MIRPGMGLAAFLDQARTIFRMQDANGDGVVSSNDAERSHARRLAGLRASVISELLRFDTNGDGIVTREEVADVEVGNSRQRALWSQPSQDKDALQRAIDVAIARTMQADLDGNGHIDWAEMLTYASRRAVGMANGPDPITRIVLAMDKNGDGETELAEFEAVVTDIFRLVDTDGDQTATKDELDAYRARIGDGRPPAPRKNDEARTRREQVQQEKRAREQAACAMPKASDRAVVVLLSVYEADALSTTTIGSQDVSVGTAPITVAAGAEPIYLVVSSVKPAIWRLEGAVDRIERLVLASQALGPNDGSPDRVPLVGATGIPSERVSFLGRPNCIENFRNVPSIPAATTASAVRREAGREPATVVAGVKVAGLAVPSGEIATRPEQVTTQLRLNVFTVLKDVLKEQIEIRMKKLPPSEQGPPGTWSDAARTAAHEPSDYVVRDLHRSSPGGVVQIDPRKVAASKLAEPYEILPGHAGLIQLVNSGAIVEQRHRRGEFMIQKKIRFPAELDHTVQFLLLRGVPEPDGNPGHARVISEETGLPIKRTRR
jgi:Ca2+-binding EF-hand superfamily protein